MAGEPTPMLTWWDTAHVSDLRGLLGLAAILALAFLFSSNRGRIPWRTVIVGLAIQVAFAALVLRWSVGRDVLDFFAGQVKALIDYTNAGIEFLFGKLVADQQETIFALQVLTGGFASVAGSTLVG